jgi:ABC-type glycerol-3-phosphate transport system substrate-binding protein
MPGSDISNNIVLNYVRENTGLDFDVVEVPEYMDTAQQFELMMSSGNIPDLIEFFDGAGAPKMKYYGLQGMFKPLDDIIANSSAISGLYDDKQREALKSDDGVTYALQSITANHDNHMIQARLDLLEEAGYTYETLAETIKTPDDLAEAARKVKALHPDSTPFIAPGFTFRSFWLYDMFNTSWNVVKYYPEDGQTRLSWADGNITKLVTWAKQMMSEGLLDPEWVTTTSGEEGEKRGTMSPLIIANNANGASSGSVGGILGGSLPASARYIDIPIPVAEGVGVDGYYSMDSLGGMYTFGINANVDDAKLPGIVKFLEFMASDKGYRDLTFFGVLGQDFEYDATGQPVALSAPDKQLPEPGSYYSVLRTFNFFFPNHIDMFYYTFHQTFHQDVPGVTAEDLESYYAKARESFEKVSGQTMGKAGYNPLEVAEQIPDDLLNRETSLREELISYISRAVTGEITLEEFEAQRLRIISENQDIADARSAAVEAAKAKYGI